MNHLILEWHTKGLPKEHDLVIYKTRDGKFSVGRYSNKFEYYLDNVHFHKNEVIGWAYLIKDNHIIINNMTAQGTDSEDNTIMMVNGYVGIETIAINPPSKMYIEKEKK